MTELIPCEICCEQVPSYQYIEHISRHSANDDVTSEKKIASPEYETEYTIIESWLELTVGLPQYFDVFILNGYSTMDKIMRLSHISKEDILKYDMGIKDVNHRYKIITEINKLNPDKQQQQKNNDDQKLAMKLHRKELTEKYQSSTTLKQYRTTMQNALFALKSCTETNVFNDDELMGTKKKNIKLLIFGYIKHIESENKLFSIIAVGIIELIFAFYPKWIPFGRCDEERVWILSEDNTVIKGRGNAGCDGYYVYADYDQYPNGMNKGIHSWSIKHIDSCDCYKSIGIVDRLHSVNKQYDIWEERKGNWSYWNGHRNWKKNQIVTVELDCNMWTVTYFDNLREIIKIDDVKSGNYYFALLLCGRRKTHFECVSNHLLGRRLYRYSNY